MVRTLGTQAVGERESAIEVTHVRPHRSRSADGRSPRAAPCRRPRRPDRDRARPPPPAPRPTRAACACFDSLRVMPWTSWPAATRRGTSCCPIAPVAPATNTLIINSLVEDHPAPRRRRGSPGCDTSDHSRHGKAGRVSYRALRPGGSGVARGLLEARCEPARRAAARLTGLRGRRRAPRRTTPSRLRVQRPRSPP